MTEEQQTRTALCSPGTGCGSGKGEAGGHPESLCNKRRELERAGRAEEGWGAEVGICRWFGRPALEHSAGIHLKAFMAANRPSGAQTLFFLQPAGSRKKCFDKKFKKIFKRGRLGGSAG